MVAKSPFPGMDPFLEGSIWPDVHTALAGAIRELIAPQIAPKYVARIEPYTAKDKSPGLEIGITYPDVAVSLIDKVEEPAVVAYGNPIKATQPDRIIPTEIVVRIPVVEIRDTEKNRLITAIEIISPVNKREPGWSIYQNKRQKLSAGGVHLLEIDLLRRGKRVVLDYGIPPTHYLFSLWRAGTEENAIWTNHIQQPLPILPVPLKSPDPDVLLPLKPALDMIYQRGLYNLSIDYSKKPPPPDFTDAENKWMRELLKV
jgi:hypothetical protein